jgi:hypothetical protein
MSEELRGQIRNNLSLKDIDELLDIWKTNNRVEWSDTTFDVLREMLGERIGEIPPQDEPILEYKENIRGDDGIEGWEEKLLDDDNQPELYDTLEVLSLRDNINKVAVAAIVIYILSGLSNIQYARALLQGVPLSLSETTQSLLPTAITILAIGLRIALVYFPLKALTHILRILMEMEFSSRKP